MYELWKKGCLDFNMSLLQTYRGLKLSESEVVLLLCLAQVMKANPINWTFQDVSNMMTLDDSECSVLYIQLLEKKMIVVSAKTDQDGKRYESYSLRPLFLLMEKQFEETRVNSSQSKSAREEVFELLEQQLGFLSPIDIETIHMWLSDDQFDPELVKLAAHEMSANQVKSIRYMDKILLEWKHKNILTVEEAKRQLINFRKRKSSALQPPTDAPKVDPSFYYDWLSEKF